MKRLIVCLMALLLSFVLFGCEQLNKYTIEFNIPDFLKKTTETKETEIKTNEASKSKSDATTKKTEEVVNYGTLNDPITAGEAVGLVMEKISPSSYSNVKAYVTGIVDSVSYNSKTSSYSCYIKTNETSTSLFQIYGGTLASGLNAPHKGDTVVACGYLYNYNGQSAEMAGSSDPVVEYPTYLKMTHSERTIAIGSHENATVELSKTTATCGEKVTATITPTTGYEIETVKANGAIIKAKSENEYVFEVTGDIIVTVKAVIEGTAVEKGTINNPYSVSEARDIADSLLNGTYSEEKYYVSGVLKSNSLNTYTNSSYNIVIVDVENDSLTFDVYSSTFDNSKETAHLGDIVTVYGNIHLFNNTTYEMSGDSKATPKITYPKIVKVEHQTKTITLGSHENAIVTNLVETAKCGDKIVFNIAVEDGLKVKSVKANDTNVTGASGEYSFILAGNTTITIEVVEAGVVTTIGTLEEPISVDEALTEITKNGANNFSADKAYVKGIVDSVSGPNAHDGYTVMIHDEDDETKTLQLYSIRISESLGVPHAGDTVIGFGYLFWFKNDYTSSKEMTGDEELYIDFPIMQEVTHKERTITTTIKNGTVTGIPDKASCGETITFTVTVNDGCTLSKVFINSDLITGTDNTYSFVVKDDTTVKIKILGVDEEEKKPTTVTKTIETIASENSWQGKDAKGNAQKYSTFNFDSVVTISCGPITGSGNTGKYYPATKSTAPTWRLYSSESAYITITVAEGYELVGFSYTQSEGGLKDYTAGTNYTISGNTITIYASIKTFITGFTVSYVEADE